MSRKAIAAVLAVAFACGAAAAAENAEHEIKALKSANYPLVEAIRLAETQGNGPAIDADFDATDRGGEYEIKVLSADGKTVREFKIDAGSGKVIEAENEPFESLFARLKSDSVLEAPMDLATAAVTAQKLAGGTALEAELDTERDTVVYNVKVAKGNTIEEIKLNAAGKLASAE
jgi:uncharacterized membrane protein YkoI